jgi:mRNA interferase RelE/StbE
VEIIFKKSFIKALQATPKSVQEATAVVIDKLQNAPSLEKSGVDYKRMEGQKKGENYYRIRIGDWRIGIQYIKPKVIIITILSRGDIYKKFPPEN